MSQRPIIVLGAGATKACGGPLTDEILPAALKGEMEHDDVTTLVQDREELLALTGEFLRDCFGMTAQGGGLPLPMVLSMLRRSVALEKPIGTWEGDRLVKAKRAIEYAIFAVIEAALQRIPPDRQFHRWLLEPLYGNGIEPTVVSMNYDVIVDNAMFALCEEHQQMRPPDYCVEYATDLYRMFTQGGTFGRLLKIHGSLNWLYCEKCRRLDLFVSKGMRTGKALSELYHSVPFDDAYSCRGTPCRNRPACDGFVSPVLITPTYVKDYDNPHIDKVWQVAEEAMKESDRAVIIGYSLPTDDVEVAMLFKRGLDHLPREKITVVEYVYGEEGKPPGERTPIQEHPTGQRFHGLFGDGLDWHTTGFGAWLEKMGTVTFS